MPLKTAGKTAEEGVHWHPEKQLEILGCFPGDILAWAHMAPDWHPLWLFSWLRWPMRLHPELSLFGHKEHIMRGEAIRNSFVRSAQIHACKTEVFNAFKLEKHSFGASVLSLADLTLLLLDGVLLFTGL